MSIFRDGQDVEYVFHTGTDEIGAMATARLAGQTLILEDVVFYPIGVDSVRLGYSTVRGMARYVEQLARLQGFTRVIMKGKRLSGAGPGRTVLVRRQL